MYNFRKPSPGASEAAGPRAERLFTQWPVAGEMPLHAEGVMVQLKPLSCSLVLCGLGDERGGVMTCVMGEGRCV